MRRFFAVSLGLVLGLAVVSLSLLGGGDTVVSSERPNIVVVSLESVPDYRLSCSGYSRNVTPNLCDFSRNATRYENTFSSSTWTPPSLTGIATGRYPAEVMERGMIETLQGDVRTMSQYLEDQGYSNYQGGMTHKRFRGQLNRSFKKLDNIDHIEKVMEQENPVYIRYHVWDTHMGNMRSSLARNNSYRDSLLVNDSYERRYIEEVRREEINRVYDGLNRFENRDFEGSKEVFSQVDGDYYNLMYDENLRKTDKLIYAEVIDAVKNSGEYEDTMIVFVGDHGELLGKYGLYGHSTYGHPNELIKVPLIVKYPGQERGKKVERPVSTVDVFPTVMEVTGSERPEVSGFDLRENVTDRNIFVRRHVLTTTIINGDHKLTHCKDLKLPYCNSTFEERDIETDRMIEMDANRSTELMNDLSEWINENDARGDSEDIYQRLQAMDYLSH